MLLSKRIFLLASSKRKIAEKMLQERGFKTELLPRGGKAYINGKWIEASSGHRFEVFDPFAKEIICDVANCGPQDAQIAVSAARKSFHRWAYEFTAKERGAVLQKCFEIMKIKEQQLAELLTKEQGKALAESRAEIQYSASFFEWYAGEARRIYGQIVPPSKLNRQHLHIREAIGVCAVITPVRIPKVPWNFPSAMICRKVGAALAAGCTIVVKPAEDTPLSALALAEISQEAGVPNGVFNIIPADRELTAEISKFLCDSPDVDCISFTGSSSIGKILLSQSASTVKRVCLELGGNAPFIVFKSADVDKAVQGAMAAKFRCCGQACVAANRFYVETSIYDEFLGKLKEKVEKLKCGNGMDKSVDIGPMINQKAVDKVTQLVKDAVEKKAELICGGEVMPETSIYKPTILAKVDDGMDIARAEIFGPVIAIQTFDSEEEVVRKANSTRNCLAGYVFTRDFAQIHRLSRAIQVGMLGVNEGVVSCAEAAFGGMKEAGLGREGGSQGIDEFTQWKYVCIDTE